MWSGGRRKISFDEWGSFEMVFGFWLRGERGGNPKIMLVLI